MARERGLAQHVPTGLGEGASETQLRVVSGMKGSAMIDPLDERQHGKTVRAQVQEFGSIFAVLFVVIGAFQWFHHHRLSIALSLFVAAGFFYTVARYAPRVMRPVWKGWMAFGGVLGFVVNTVLLSAVWAAMVIPIALILRIVGKRVMDLSFKAPVDSYWLPRREEQADFTLLERQF